MNNFEITRKCSQTEARLGELHTPHGVVPTPVFLPVGSQATVKALTPDDLKSLGFKMLLSNTYHLYLRPGIEVIRELGGLHKFMSWDSTLLTDSGGYQVFSLAPLRRVNDEGVNFRSHIDGSQHFLTPELAIKYQEALGADVIMALDECPPHDASFEQVKEATLRTHRWAERCKKAHKNNDQSLFGIVQGGLFSELRKESAEFLTSLDLPGYAVGGLSLGEPKEVMNQILEQTTVLLPGDKPRYLMGVGSPEDIIESVARGVDIFDCALPTRVARNGGFFTWSGRLNIRNASFSRVKEPVDLACRCYTCRNFSAAYLHHLFNAGELLAYRLATIHNLFFMSDLMERIRDAIGMGNYAAFRQTFLTNFKTTDEEIRLSQKQKWLKNRRLEETNQ